MTVRAIRQLLDQGCGLIAVIGGMAFSRGPWKHKWWYMLGGLAVVHVVNILRISVVGIVMEAKW